MSETQLLATAVVTLAGVVTFLFGLLLKFHKDTRDRLSACEEDRERLWEEIAGIKDTVSNNGS